jgi:hypothetical protein
MDTLDCFIRRVRVDASERRGTVALPPDFFERTGIGPGHHVVVAFGDNQLRIKARSDDIMKADEVTLTPKTAYLLGVREGDVVCVQDRKTFGDRLFDEVEKVTDVLGSSAVRLKEFVSPEPDMAAKGTVEEAIEGYLLVHPNEPGSVAVQVCDIDLTPTPEVWSPDPKGKRAVFRPGDEEGDGTSED